MLVEVLRCSQTYTGGDALLARLCSSCDKLLARIDFPRTFDLHERGFPAICMVPRSPMGDAARFAAMG
jgi:hypothetical protein